MVINAQDTNYHPSGRVISIKSQLYIPSAENNFPPVASAPAEGTQYAAANFNLSKKLYIFFDELLLLGPVNVDIRHWAFSNSKIFHIFN